MDNKNNIDISVIMPVYNGETYLKEALDSLLCQTISSFEILCVDDGSTDGTMEILKQYRKKDEKIQILCQDHKGAGAARNYGFSKAQGTYVIFLDADDIFCETMMEKIVKKGDKTGAEVILFGAKRYDNRTGELLNTSWYLRKKLLPEKEVFSRLDVEGRLLEVTIPSPWTKAYRRDFVESKNLYFQNLPNSNDVYFSLVSLAVAEKITAIKEDLLYYRVFREGSLQNKKHKEPLCFLEAFEAVYTELKQRDVYEDVARGFCNRVISGCSYQIDSTHDESALWKIVEALCSERFMKMGIFDYPEEDPMVLKKRNHLQGLPYALAVHEKFEKAKIIETVKSVVVGTDNSEKKVSVIIPVFNTSKYLNECLDSILNQSLKEIEVLCIDDGSTDCSLKILCEYAKQDARISVLHQENSGQAVARNAGVEKAVGEYIYFMDSDDVLKEDALEHLYNRAKEIQLDILYFDAVTIYENENVKECHPEFENCYLRRGVYPKQCSGQEMFVKMKEQKEYRVSPCIQFFRREFLEEENLRFYPGIVHEDNDFSFRSMLLAKRTGYVNETYFMRRLRASSTMTSTTKFAHVYGYFKSFLNMIAFVQKFQYPSEMTYIVYDEIDRMLIAAKNGYNKLSDLEKCGAMGLDGIDRYFFHILIENDAEQYAKLHRTYAEKSEINRKLQITYGEKFDRGVEIKRLKKEISSIKKSKTYRLARIIGAPIRMLRKIKRKIAGVQKEENN